MRRGLQVLGYTVVLLSVACSESVPTAATGSRSSAIVASGAASRSTLASLTVDQAYEGPFAFGMGVNAEGGVAQGFTPTANRLDAVDVFFTGSGSNPPLALGVSIRSGSFDGPTLGSTVLVIPAGVTGTASAPTVIQGIFATPVTLVPGALYYLHVDPDGGFLGVAASFGNGYGGGDAYQGDFTLSGLDFGFRTYVGVDAPPPPVGPTTKDDCKKGGWATYTQPRAFKNQGDCVSYVNNGK